MLVLEISALEDCGFESHRGYFVGNLCLAAMVSSGVETPTDTENEPAMQATLCA